MQLPFTTLASSFDPNAVHETIQRALTSAGLDTTTGPMRDVTETIRRALAAGRFEGSSTSPESKFVVDVEARVVQDGEDERPISKAGRLSPPLTQPKARPSISEAPQRPGSFEAHTFSNGVGTLAYKVYAPAVKSDGPRAMVVMLHGCTQSADDFAAGTQMNRLADEHGFLVVYPEQSAHGNTSKCWNWFRPQDQVRDAGEPSLIAGIVCKVADQHGADQRRIFVAGLSAGAAMAVVMGESYPELFAGVGVHSGLPYGSAHDIPSALAVMKGGRSGLPGLKSALEGTKGARKKAVQGVPIIVFHGDRDHTVQHSNGESIVKQAKEAHSSDAGGGMRVQTQAGVSSGGRRFSREVHTDFKGQVRIESWTLHGGGHAWSGGHPSGSYTDRIGPDASAEMVRFFLALPRCGSA